MVVSKDLFATGGRVVFTCLIMSVVLAASTCLVVYLALTLSVNARNMARGVVCMFPSASLALVIVCWVCGFLRRRTWYRDGRSCPHVSWSSVPRRLLRVSLLRRTIFAFRAFSAIYFASMGLVSFRATYIAS
jgi:hypothetical protein